MPTVKAFARGRSKLCSVGQSTRDGILNLRPCSVEASRRRGIARFGSGNATRSRTGAICRRRIASRRLMSRDATAVACSARVVRSVATVGSASVPAGACDLRAGEARCAVGESLRGVGEELRRVCGVDPWLGREASSRRDVHRRRRTEATCAPGNESVSSGRCSIATGRPSVTDEKIYVLER